MRSRLHRPLRTAALAGLLIAASQVQAQTKQAAWSECQAILERLQQDVDTMAGALPSVPAPDARRITAILDQARRLKGAQSYTRASEAHRLPNYDLWALRDSLNIASREVGRILEAPRMNATRVDIAKAARLGAYAFQSLLTVKDMSIEYRASKPDGIGPIPFEVNALMQAMSVYVGCAAKVLEDAGP